MIQHDISKFDFWRTSPSETGQHDSGNRSEKVWLFQHFFNHGFVKHDSIVFQVTSTRVERESRGKLHEITIGQWHPVGQFFWIALLLQEMIEKYSLTQAIGPWFLWVSALRLHALADVQKMQKYRIILGILGSEMQEKVASKEPEALEAELLGFLGFWSLKLQDLQDLHGFYMFLMVWYIYVYLVWVWATGWVWVRSSTRISQ